ncbi:MAG: hypothetical protein FWC80_01100 [Firmicutes bacterium]|nr:hypothetical protein [Bacillota bacterium]
MKNWVNIDYWESVSENDEENHKILKLEEESLVVFLDIMNFKQLSNDSKKVIFILRAIEQLTNDYYDLAPKSKEDEEYIQSLDEGDLEEEKDLNESDEYGFKRIVFEDEVPKYQIFSDSIIITHHLRCANLHNFLSYVSKLQFELFSCGVLIRGGISLGLAINIPSFVFGKGVINAYLLESKKAVFPRVLIDEAVLNFFHKESFYEKWVHTSAGYGNYDSNFMAFVKSDKDGMWYVDYLQSNFLPRYLNKILYGQLIANSLNENSFDDSDDGVLSHDFCQNYLVNMIETIKEGLAIEDEWIKQKYVWLKNYYNTTIKFCIAKSTKKEKIKYKMALEQYLIEDI